jgi:hypothetical protein
MWTKMISGLYLGNEVQEHIERLCMESIKS